MITIEHNKLDFPEPFTCLNVHAGSQVIGVQDCWWPADTDRKAIPYFLLNTTIFLPSSVLNDAILENEVSAFNHVSFLLLVVVLSEQLSRHMLVDQKRFTGVLDLGDGAFEVEGF